MSTSEEYPELMFFLGAGASIDAGLVGVIQLIAKFKEWLKFTSKIEQLNIVDEILSILQMWKQEKYDPSNIDIELLLDIIERLEDRDHDLLSFFYANKTLRLEKYTSYESVYGKKKLSSELKQFIRQIFSDTQLKTDYLQPLNHLINEYRVLSIFSTNYDACIEKFCRDNSKKLVDGFNPNWNPMQEYSRPGIHVCLYKLHGSITWYRSEQGDYTRSDIIVKNDKVFLLDGQQMIPLILYPGRKYSFFAPLLYNLLELQKTLRIAKYVVVVGYSFKDWYITKIFQDAAKENNELTLLLISPNAAKIYQDNLEAVDDPEISHGSAFRGFSEDFDKQLASSLKGKVILLPYMFKTIFPSIRNYIDKLKKAQQLEKQLTEIDEPNQYFHRSNDCLKLFVECEHMERATELFHNMEINLISLEEWASTFELVLQSLLHVLASGDESLIYQWKEKLSSLGKFFSVDKFQFVPMIEDNIRLEKINNISPIIFANILDTTDFLFKQKMSMITKEEIDKRVDILYLKLQQIRTYLEPWLKGKLTYADYVEKRKDKHSIEIQNLKVKIPEYRNKGVEDASITDIINRIERKELEDIFGGTSVTINLDFNS